MRLGWWTHGDNVASTSTESKDCRYCVRQIDSRATFCPNCGKSQNVVRNALLFVGSTIGIPAVLFSASLYLWNEGALLYQKVFGEDNLVVHSLMENDDVVIYNRGDRGLNLLRLRINHVDFARFALYDIYEPLPTDSMVRFTLGEQTRHHLVPTGSEPFGTYRSRLEQLARSDTESVVYPVATIAGDSDYKFRKNDYISSANAPWPKEYACDAELYYVRFGESEEVPFQFRCISMIYSKDPLGELHNFLRPSGKRTAWYKTDTRMRRE